MSLSSDINKWNNDRRKDLEESYKEKGFKASGDWANDLDPQQVIKYDSITIKMNGSEYTGAMINGRKPSKSGNPKDPKLIGKIKKWVKDKGIVANPYSITKTIHKFGTLQYRKPNAEKKKLLTDAYTEEDFKDLYKIVNDNIVQEIQNTVINILK